jgi:VWFA-related protein
MQYLRKSHLLLVFAALFSGAATAQVLSMPTTPGGKFGGGMQMDPIQNIALNFDVFLINSRNANRTPLASPSGTVSTLDGKAPAKAKREYTKGYKLLQRKQLRGAVEHLTKAIKIYPNFVSAHNAVGTAYLELNQNQLAREEFAKAVALDDHLPSPLLNLGIAQLALKEYAGAEESLRKASSLAPLDLQLSLALAYAEFANQDYPAVLATAREVHARNHKGAAMVHYFAAQALAAQGNLVQAQQEMETLLGEEPQSPSADQYRQIIKELRAEQDRRAEAKLHPAAMPVPTSTPAVQGKNDIAQGQQALQDEAERSQIAEAEAASDLASRDAAVPDVHSRLPSPPVRANRDVASASGFVLHSSVDEVNVFFAATNGGKSVTDLTLADIHLLDNRRAPDKVIGFRNESQLPLRLGLVVDTSASVKQRLSFEQKAAITFLDRVVTDNQDLAFVVGVNNSVLLLQDFTPDRTLLSQSVNRLAAGGGTALWDAVSFASAKLAARPEAQPVARVLVVISDGEDNSSSTVLKEVIASALRNETVIYAVSTRELTDETSSSLVGDRALRTLSELTGGAAFVPGSLHHLSGSLGDVQQVIRGRYLLTYKPAEFQRDGRYRSIELAAERDGHRFRVFARKGYYASVADPNSDARP